MAFPGSAKQLKKLGSDGASVVSRIVRGTGEVAEQVWKRGDDLVDGMKIHADDALDVAEDFLGNGYRESMGGFISADGTKRVRVTDSDLADINNHAGAPHFNFERGKTLQKPNGKEYFKVNDNMHIYVTE